MEERKRIRDTKLGAWLKEKAPDVFDAVKDALPESGVLGVVKNLVGGSDEVDMMIAQLELEYSKEVTKRWEADMKGDNKLAKVVRPVTLVALLSIMFVFATLDSFEAIPFDVKDAYIDMVQALSMTAFGAYFAGRSYEKTKR